MQSQRELKAQECEQAELRRARAEREVQDATVALEAARSRVQEHTALGDELASLKARMAKGVTESAAMKHGERAPGRVLARLTMRATELSVLQEEMKRKADLLREAQSLAEELKSELQAAKRENKALNDEMEDAANR